MRARAPWNRERKAPSKDTVERQLRYAWARARKYGLTEREAHEATLEAEAAWRFINAGESLPAEDLLS